MFLINVNVNKTINIKISPVKATTGQKNFKDKYHLIECWSYLNSEFMFLFKSDYAGLYRIETARWNKNTFSLHI